MDALRSIIGARTSTDNILISVLVNTISVGLYSNYSMIIGYIQAFINQFTTALYYSMGNMFAIEKKEYCVSMVNKLTYILYFLTSLCACCLFCLLNPFISLWIGPDYLLNVGIVAICVFNFYFQVLKIPMWHAISGLGYFKEDRNIALWGATRETSSAPITICDNVWIGTGAMILKGVTIGEGAVVAAGAIVTKDVPQRCLVGGVPAKVIRENVEWENNFFK